MAVDEIVEDLKKLQDFLEVVAGVFFGYTRTASFTIYYLMFSVVTNWVWP